MDLSSIVNPPQQAAGGGALRDYRKGNWTLQETMVLIEAKKMDDERRMKRVVGDSGERAKPAELRWKWVEDYCWKNGCLRSQNQCNDKWDNLMRDFKRVREYEARRLTADEKSSYWAMAKNDRKENSLPSNMLSQIYEALVEVVERRGQRTAGLGGSAMQLEQFSHAPPPALGSPVTLQELSVPPLLQLPPPPPPPPLPGQATPESEDTSEYTDSPAKRRRRSSGGGVEGTSSRSTLQEVGSAISRSAEMIAEAMQTCEEREERRHKQVMSLNERRLQIEESKAEMNRQGINGLVEAINSLASSILALAKNPHQP